MSEGIFAGHMRGPDGGATGIHCVEARDAANYPTRHRSYNKDFSTQNVNSVEVEKPALVRLGVFPGRLLSSLTG